MSLDAYCALCNRRKGLDSSRHDQLQHQYVRPDCTIQETRQQEKRPPKNLTVLRHKYERPICIVSKDFANDSVFLSNPDLDRTQTTCMFLAYTGSNHYVSILPWPTIFTSVPQVTATRNAGSSVLLSAVCEPAASTLMSSKLVMSKQTVAEEEATGTDRSAAVLYPHVWTFDKWKSWKSKQPWLICQNGKLGCEVCCEPGTALTMKIGVHVSPEWTAVSVEAKTARKLKKKIYRHKDSSAHIAAGKILQLQQQECFKSVIVDADSRHFEETSRVFSSSKATISYLSSDPQFLAEILTIDKQYPSWQVCG